MQRRLVYGTALVVFIAYGAWMIGPFVRSTIVRDSSVTTWSRLAVAPIDGRITSDLPPVGYIVGEDHVIATIQNDHILEQRQIVENVRDRMVAARSRLQGAQEYLSELEALEAGRQRTAERTAAAFKAHLAMRIESLRREIAANDESIAIVERMVRRDTDLADRGVGAKATLDETLLRLSELRAQRAEQKVELDFALIRQASAKDGIFLTDAGETPAWVHFTELEIKLANHVAHQQSEEALATLDEAERDLKIAQATLGTLQSSPVTAPAGSLIFSLYSAPGSTVSAGDRIVEWIDCSVLLVDVPVSDVEVALIAPGAPAEVILEGESDTRNASVHLVRGASAVLDHRDLAAVAKGREDGVGQVILTLDARLEEFSSCPVGRAAYVEFPKVGLLDILMARLRL